MNGRINQKIKLMDELIASFQLMYLKLQLATFGFFYDVSGKTWGKSYGLNETFFNRKSIFCNMFDAKLYLQL